MIWACKQAVALVANQTGQAIGHDGNILVYIGVESRSVGTVQVNSEESRAGLLRVMQHVEHASNVLTTLSCKHFYRPQEQ
jgi:hypothetical protein